ncbi:DoxX family protein [Corynebacterium breve]|uniref:DoxX family protein n=1 Tax=Corynebacterium breve TaxID=3049799 RepID=A0ABY8VKF3_9CORY|nr:DoxX family protein [Corynebacterium breve]WIM68674.1 DoxX family protein [Corynebacterium breve]
MSDKSTNPNNQHFDNLDDMQDLDVPTYQGNSSDASTSIYQRSGKAAPESVGPQQPATETISMDRGSQSTADTEFAPVSENYDNYESPQYVSAPATDSAANSVTVADRTEVEEDKPTEHRRGTIDFGLFLLRLLLGGYLIFSAVTVFFRLGGNEGLGGLEKAFADYAAGDLLAVIVPTLQLAAGVFLVLGLLTPVAAMIATIVTGFMALHEVSAASAGFNAFSWPESAWLALILFGLSVVVQFTGPGLYSFDTGRGWARRPLVSSWVFIILGVAGVVAAWWFGTGINPFA